MPNKRLLIVSFIFPPQLLARSLQLLKTANALSLAGWKLTVYTADPKLLKDKLDPALGEKLDKSIKLIPGYTFENWFFSNVTASLSLGMPDDKYVWRFAGKKALKKLLGDPVCTFPQEYIYGQGDSVKKIHEILKEKFDE